MSPLRKIRTEIGKLLLQRKIISSAQLDEALYIKNNRERDKYLGQILLGLGYVTKEDLYFVLAVQSGYPYIQISRCKIDSLVIGLIPRDIVEKYQVLPIDKIQDIVTVAMVNPLDKVALAHIQEITGGIVKVFLTTSSDWDEMFLVYYARN
jgi:type IV pilus assembly protein PilB